MFDNITVKAGKNAFDLIQDGAFSPSMINTVPAASGGPKFLVLNGFDRALFSSWFKKPKHPLQWIASSIGSWRGAALAQSDPLSALDKLEDAYIHQQYSFRPAPDEISSVAWGILHSYLPENEIRFILKKSKIRLHIFTARSKGLGISDNKLTLGTYLSCAMGANWISRKALGLFFSRSVYSAGDELPPCITHIRDFSTQRHELGENNFTSAVIGSGSIPLAMTRVEMEDGSVIRDGGLIDYHFDIPFAADTGITFYPHYTDTILPGWFDKHLPWRHAGRLHHANTILVSPSKEFVEKLPNGKIPDRKDFALYKGRDRERFTDWGRVVKRSQILGDEMIEAFESGRVKKIIRPL